MRGIGRKNMSSITKEEFLEVESSLKDRISQGDIDACKTLGDLYYQGYSGNDQNDEKAFPYWKKAADAGNVSAAGIIGIRLFTGTYGKNREAEAIPYLMAAADAGANGPGPQYMLGMAYQFGRGCRENKALAEKYFRMAALQNDGNAQYNLGRLLFLKQDDEYMHWICCAHINGNKDATELLNTFIQNSDDKAGAKQAIEWSIEDVQKNGIVPKKRSGSSSGSGGGCYIATAVYGSYNAAEVMTLRRFRDETLMNHWWGRAFVKIYYTLSPSVADKLKNEKRINSIVRAQLDLFVKHLRKKDHTN